MVSIFWSFLFLSVSAFADPSPTPTPFESQMLFDQHPFSYFSNAPITTQNPAIEEAVIVIHGSDRNAVTYFRTLNITSAQVGKAASTLVIAPHYKESGDLIFPNELIFSSEGWLRGDGALNDRGLSSYEVMDQFLTLLSNRAVFPNLKTIVVTGHSAGGQFTQRYAVSSQIENSNPQIHFRYVVVNPGSYVYLNAKRPSANNPASFSLPQNPGCNYNDYKYGLDHLNAYFSRVETGSLIQKYLTRDVVYLLGEADQLLDELDDDCPAHLQGPYRYARGLNFKAFLDHEFAGHLHRLLTVPAIGHTEWGMYASANGKKSIFDFSF